MSGYSKTPLAKKLGFKSGMRIRFINAPNAYQSWIEPIPPVEFAEHPPYNFVHIFENRRIQLESALHDCRRDIYPDGMIWVSWHKKASKLPTEITEDTIRELALPIGLVDIKVCSVNETWSGLKLVIRKELR